MARCRILQLALGAMLPLLVAACSAPGSSPPAQGGATGAVTPQGQSQPQAPAPEPARLTISYSSPSGAQAHVWIASDTGIFRKYGLEVEVQFISGPQSVPALLSGDIQVGITSSEPVIAAVAEGADLAIIATPLPLLSQIFFVRPEIQSAADLRGKTVGVSRFGDISDFAAREALRRLGLDPEKDVTVVQVRDVPTRLAAMESGSIQAGPFSPPNSLRARKAGFQPMVDMMAEGVEFPAAHHIILRRWGQQNRQTVLSYMKAIMEAIKVNKSDEELAIQLFAKYAQVTDQEIAKEAVSFAAATLPAFPLTSRTGLQRVVDALAAENPKAANTTYESLTDMSYLRELEASGFVKTLYP